MRVIVSFVRAYPWQSLGVLLALFVAGAVEGVSVSAGLPLLGLLFGEEAGATLGSIAPARFVTSALARVGIAPDVESLVAFLVLGVLAGSAIRLFAKTWVGYVVARVATDLRLELLQSLLKARWEYFVRLPVGRLANAMASEVDRSSKAYLYSATVAASVIQLIAYTVVAMFVSWWATLAYLAAALVLTWSLHGLVRVARQAGRRQTKLMKSILAGTTDVLQSVKPLKAMAREAQANAVLAVETRQLNRALRRQVVSKEGMRAVRDPAGLVLVVIAAWVGFSVWQLPKAEIAVLLVLLTRVLNGFGKVQDSWQDLVTCESAYGSLRATIDDANRQIEPLAGSRAPHLERAIRFDEIGFGYEGRPVLRGLSLEIPAGAFTALIGHSGAGKTTIVDLVIGLLRPQSGRIWIDDVPLDEIDLAAWRRATGYVPQENVLLHDSVLANVTLGDPALGPAEAERALRAADAWEFVTKLPQGIETPVGERGSALSGGQRQRILIARALVRRPLLLILDEATSALDPATAAGLAQTLRRLRGEVTILAVSHQADLIDAADRIYRLEKGQAILADDRNPTPAPTGS